MNAAKLAIEENRFEKRVNLKLYLYDNDPLAPIKTYMQMKKDKCSAIVGYEYLSDLLLAISVKDDMEVPIFSSYSSKMDSDKLRKNIFLLMPSYDFLSKKMFSFLVKKFGNLHNSLIVTEVDNDAMLKYKTVYSKLLDSKNIKYDTFDFLENDKKFKNKLYGFMKDKSYDHVFLLASAINSSKIADLINNQKIIFVGTEYFGSSVEQSFYMRLNKKLINAYFVRNIDFLGSNGLFKKFEDSYNNKYHSNPTVLSLYTYDAVNFILNALQKKGNINTDSILNVDYVGITGACIKKGVFHSSKKYVVLSVGRDGYIYEK